jgi:hypothetical protein
VNADIRLRKHDYNIFPMWHIFLLFTLKLADSASWTSCYPSKTSWKQYFLLSASLTASRDIMIWGLLNICTASWYMHIRSDRYDHLFTQDSKGTSGTSPEFGLVLCERPNKQHVRQGCRSSYQSYVWVYVQFKTWGKLHILSCSVAPFYETNLAFEQKILMCTETSGVAFKICKGSEKLYLHMSNNVLKMASECIYKYIKFQTLSTLYISNFYKTWSPSDITNATH